MPDPFLPHPRLPRRQALQVGALGLLGLGMHQLPAMAAAHPGGRRRACIYIFLSGGLAQHDSFDMKPDAPDDVRGEFAPISTRTPGVQICEHLPLLAQRSHLWALCRSVSHSSNEHSAAHHIMLTGRSDLPAGFSPTRPQPSDHPSIAAISGALLPSHNDLPAAAVLPEKLVHNSGRIIPGQFAARLGAHRDPWFIEASPFHARSYGAFPPFAFDHQQRGDADERQFEAPNLSLPFGLTQPRFQQRRALLAQLDAQRARWDQAASARQLDEQRQAAVSLLTSRTVHHALDVTRADPQVRSRYGENSFGWSLLMAKRLVEAGVSLVQVNLGNNETWDTHGNAFPHLKDHLFPPTDQALAALLDDLQATGILEDTLVVVAGEFGRTPKITLLPSAYAKPGRDHWGAVQSVLFAGGGTPGGHVVGASDRIGAYPADSPQRPENLAATIYHALRLPPTAAWHDALDRPHHIYQAAPIF